MELDCGTAVNDSDIEFNPILLLPEIDLKSVIMCNDDDKPFDVKDLDSDLAELETLDMLSECVDGNLFANSSIECLPDINPSPELPSLDVNPFENADSLDMPNSETVPLYGPFLEFESPPPLDTDVMDELAVPGIVGLQNLGNTCFMNSGLQCLINNPIFATYFNEIAADSLEEGTLSVKFAQLMKKAWSGNFVALHLGEFKERFGSMYAQFRNFRQHDCQEFLALLLDTIHEELNRSNKNKNISFANANNRKDLRKTIANQLSDAASTSAMEVCEAPEVQDKSECDSRDGVIENEEEVDTCASRTNNLKDIPSIADVKEKTDSDFINIADQKPTIYERNTEKMAVLLINNTKCEELAKSSTNSQLSPADALNKSNYIQNVNENIIEKNELAYKLNSVQKIPSIEDFVKDAKTLNTNVLVNEETNNLFKFDSEKFPKHDSNRLLETVDNLGQIVDLGAKQGGLKRVKITNLLYEKQSNSEYNLEISGHKRLKTENVDSELEAALIQDQEDGGDIEQIPGDEFSEGSSQSSELYALNSDCQELLVAEEIRRAYSAWDQYKSLNQSVVVDTFHGQFRSSVVCNQCSHNSITYEPFMYLPVFLPHTLERQIVITFIPNNGTHPVRFLVNVNKYDRILKIREALQKLLDSSTEEIVLAEVFQNHISRFLDESQSIRRINDSTRLIYAFEVGKTAQVQLDAPKNIDEDSTSSNSFKTAMADSNSSPENLILSSDCGTDYASSMDADCDLFKDPDKHLFENIEDFPSCSTQLMSNVDLANDPGTIELRSCAICLEDYPYANLSLHPNCECILCSTCIEVSCKHYGGSTFVCPVCNAPIAPSEDLVPLSNIGDYHFKVSTIPIPIVMRNDTFCGDILLAKVLIGHPALLKLPTSLPAPKLYECVDSVIPFISTYSLLLVDGQGINCSRCLYSKHCSGCEISRTGDIKLQPNDNIAVRYIDLPNESVTSASFVAEDKSMQESRHKTELDIYDCLEYFTERESLDEDSTWFCPVCRRNQQATKSLSVWKFPQILIIYLKRFVFHNFMSIKVEDKVTYPVEGLNLSAFSSGPFSGELVYDLQSCVCHFGGVSAGHYTSYSKHALTREWYCYNDETFKKEAPNTDECTNEYIFFYQKR